MSQELSADELTERIASLKEELAKSTNIMKTADLQDEIDALTGDAERRSIALCSIDDPRRGS